VCFVSPRGSFHPVGHLYQGIPGYCIHTADWSPRLSRRATSDKTCTAVGIPTGTDREIANMRARASGIGLMGGEEVRAVMRPSGSTWTMVLARVGLLAVLAGLLLASVVTVTDARKSKSKLKAKSREGSLRHSTEDWQALLRAGEGRHAADVLLAKAGTSGGAAVLQHMPTEAVVSRAAVTITDEWELYSLGAALLREYSGNQGPVKAGLAMLGHVAAQGGQAATPAHELSEGTKYKVMSNMMPCKEKGSNAADCHPFRTWPLPPQPEETARARRAVGGWIGEALAGATVSETVSVDGDMNVTLLSQEPLIATVSGFISPDEASRLVDSASRAISSRLPGGDLCVKPVRATFPTSSAQDCSAEYPA
jgi:hypothetical protein